MLQWSRGNRLTAFGNNTYVYNSDGIRIKKTVGNVVHDFFVEGEKIVGEKIGNQEISYLYDLTGITGIKTGSGESQLYFFQKNILGDIVAIVDYTGTVVANYYYDAWGNHRVSITSGVDTPNHVGRINPFRYRGYYYDSETGLYYLNARYYDPSIGRFINADDSQYLEPDSIFGLNAYAYCYNNPVMWVDPSGHWIDYAIDICFIALGAYDCIKDPSWDKIGWLALDVFLAVIPFIPAVSGARHLSKIDDVVDLTKKFGHIDNFADAGGVIRKAVDSDFADNGWDLVQGLNKSDDGFTISNKFIGTEIHTKFKYSSKVIDLHNRVDGIDDFLRLIYELKPYNTRSIKQGIKQLYRYQKAAYKKYGFIYEMVLVLY